MIRYLNNFTRLWRLAFWRHFSGKKITVLFYPWHHFITSSLHLIFAIGFCNKYINHNNWTENDLLSQSLISGHQVLFISDNFTEMGFVPVTRKSYKHNIMVRLYVWTGSTENLCWFRDYKRMQWLGATGNWSRIDVYRKNTTPSLLCCKERFKGWYKLKNSSPAAVSWVVTTD